MLKYLLAWFMPIRLYGGGNTQSTRFDPPDFTKPLWENYVNGVQGVANPSTFAPYTGMTVADLSPMTQNGLQMQSDFTTQGTPERNTTGQIVQNVGQGAMNPYATMNDAYTGSTNQYEGQTNPFMGENPYLRNMINTSNQMISDQYRTGTAAQTDAQFARGGAYGGSAYQDQVGRNQRQLLGALGANTNSLLKGNYDQSAGLAEQGLNRSSGLAESALNRGAGLTEAGLNRATQAWQSGQQNALGAGSLGLGQQGADQQAITAMLASGQIPQQYQQQLLQAAKDYYTGTQQSQIAPWDFIGNSLSRASGGVGTQTQVGAGQSSLLGGAGLATILGTAFGGS